MGSKAVLSRFFEKQLLHPEGRAQNYKTLFISTCASLSFELLFVKQFDESLENSYKVLELSPEKTWVKTNIAHALLFLNRFQEAKKIYIENADEKLFNGEKTFRQAVLDDFNELRKHNITHKDMQKIEYLYTR